MANHFGNNPVFLDDTANGDRFATPPSCWKVLQYPLTDSYQKQVLYIYKSMNKKKQSWKTELAHI